MSNWKITVDEAKDVAHMIKITICNETESDRNEILKLVSKAVAGSNMMIHEIEMCGELSFLSEDHTFIRLRSRDIFYFEYVNRKIKIVTDQVVYICIGEKIGELADKMKKYGFVMSHRSFVVNVHKIERMTSHSLVMKNGDKVYLAQKRVSLIRKELRSQGVKILL